MAKNKFQQMLDERKDFWQQQWSSDEYAPGWLDRGIAPELVGARKQGWLPATGNVLDIGCGLADTAAWFANEGYQACAFDIAEAAIEKAQQRYGDMEGRLRLLALDLCAEDIPGGPYNILIDRGCFHQIPEELKDRYIAAILAVASDDAKMAVFCAAYRRGRPMGDPVVQQHHLQLIRNYFGQHFNVVHMNDTYMDKDYGKGPGTPLPGIAFWLERKQAGQ